MILEEYLTLMRITGSDNLITLYSGYDYEISGKSVQKIIASTGGVHESGDTIVEALESLENTINNRLSTK